MRKPFIIRRINLPDCQVTIELNEWLPGITLAALIFWYLASPSKIAAMAIVTLVGLFGAAYGWCAVTAKLVHGQRHLRYTAVQVGDELEEEVTLINKSALPVLWARFVDHSSIPEYTVTSVRAANPNNNAFWRAHVRCTRRGIFSLGPWELLLGDPFGLLCVRKRYLVKQQILVYPSLAVLPEDILPRTGVQGDAHSLHQPVPADTIDATSTRSYSPGDPLRHLHWRTTARKNALFVKQFEPEASASVWIVPDCDALVHLGSGSESTFETMILLAASLAARLLQEHMAVGLYVNSRESTIILPQRGPAELWRLLHALAPLQPEPGYPLKDTIAGIHPLLSANQRLVIITPSLEPSWLSAAQHLAGLRTRGRVEMLLLDPGSFGGDQNASQILPLLSEAGIQAHSIRKGEIVPLQAVYGELSQWEFKEGATGKAILRKAPREAGGIYGPSERPRHRTWEQPE